MSAAVDTPPEYAAVLEYDGAAVAHDERDQLISCALQPRDVELLHAIHRHKLLTSTQLLEIGWDGRSAQAGRRRLVMLFRAGLVDRFRPIRRKGSYPWTYQLAPEGHRILVGHGLIPAGQRFRRRLVSDYGHVLHDLHVNAWALAWRRLLGSQLAAWNGETQIDAPRSYSLHVGDGYSVRALRDAKPKQLRPDDLLEVARRDGDGTRTFMVEYDRTQRIDKNYTKFRRYDAFVCGWWRESDYGTSEQPPWVVFLCVDASHRDAFIDYADRELTGYLWHPSMAPEDYEYPGRARILFASERDMYEGDAVAFRVPPFPPDHPARDAAEAPQALRLPSSRSSNR